MNVLVAASIVLIRMASTNSGVARNFSNHRKLKPCGGNTGYAVVVNAVATTTMIGASK